MQSANVRACQTCRTLKIKCEPARQATTVRRAADVSNGTGLPAIAERPPCRRCQDNHTPCIYTEPKRTKTKRTDVRVRELEQHVQRLSELLIQRRHAATAHEAATSAPHPLPHAPAPAPEPSTTIERNRSKFPTGPLTNPISGRGQTDAQPDMDPRITDLVFGKGMSVCTIMASVSPEEEKAILATLRETDDAGRWTDPRIGQGDMQDQLCAFSGL